MHIRKAAIVSVLYLQATSQENLVRKIHNICQEIQQKVKEVIGIETSIGIGSWVRSPQDMIYSYKLAEKALRYRYLLGGSLLFDMEEKKTDNSINIVRELEILTDEMKAGNRQEVTEILEEDRE